MSNSIRQNVFPSVDTFNDTRSGKLYVPSLNPQRYTSEQQVEAYKKKGKQHLNKLNPWKILQHQEILRYTELLSCGSYWYLYVGY